MVEPSEFEVMSKPETYGMERPQLIKKYELIHYFLRNGISEIHEMKRILDFLINIEDFKKEDKKTNS